MQIENGPARKTSSGGDGSKTIWIENWKMQIENYNRLGLNVEYSLSNDIHVIGVYFPWKRENAHEEVQKGRIPQFLILNL